MGGEISVLINGRDPDKDPLKVSGVTREQWQRSRDGSTVRYTPVEDSSRRRLHVHGH